MKHTQYKRYKIPVQS